MNFFPATSCIILICAADVCTANVRSRLTAVSSGDIARALYRRVRKEVPKVETLRTPHLYASSAPRMALDLNASSSSDPESNASPTLDVDEKNEICDHMTRSGYHSGVAGDIGVYTHEIYERLKALDPKIEVNGLRALPRISLAEIMKTNPTQLIDAYVAKGDERCFLENVFTCFTVDPSYSEHIAFSFFVTREYNMSDTPNPYVAGRFILHYRYGEDIMQISAVAEEPAKPMSTKGKAVERLYLSQRRAGYEPVANQMDDPMCKLTPEQRLRVCTVVLSAAYFETDFRFVPIHEYIDESRCFEKRIAFEDEQARLEAEDNDWQEWMISCRAESRQKTKFQFEFFLSRVYNSINQVFVYRRKEGSDSATLNAAVLENLFANVRFKI